MTDPSIKEKRLYLLTHGVSHFAKVGVASSNGIIRRMLSNFRYMAMKLSHPGLTIIDLVRDYEHLIEDDLITIKKALRLSSRPLLQNSDQLAAQLIGRLHGNTSPGIIDLLVDARREARLLWPLNNCLTRPDSPYLQALTALGHGINAITLSNDGCLLAIALTDETIHLMDIARAESVRIFGVSTNDMRREYSSVLITNDSKTLIAGHWKGWIHIFNIKDGSKVGSLPGHEEPLTDLTLTPDQKFLLSSSWDKTIKVWDLTSYEEVFCFTEHNSGVDAVAIFPDGRRVASGSRKGPIKIWNRQNGGDTLNLEGHLNGVQDLAVSADGNLLFSCSWDRTIRVWDTSSGAELAVLIGHTGEVSKIRITRDGARAVSCSEDNTIRVWDLHTYKELYKLHGHGMQVGALALSNDDLTIISGAVDGIVRLWKLGGRGTDTSPTFSTGDFFALWMGRDQCLGISDAIEFMQSSFYAGPLRPEEYTEADYQAREPIDADVDVWNLQTESRILKLKGHTDHIRSAKFSTTGSYVATGSQDETIRIWCLRKGDSLATLKGHEGSVTDVMFSPNERWLISLSYDGSMRIWDWWNQGVISIYKPGGRRLRNLSVIGDGDLSITIAFSVDAKVQVLHFDGEKAQLLSELSTNWCTSLSLSKKFPLLLAGTDTGTIKLFNYKDNQELYSLENGDGNILKLCFLPGEKTYISASETTTLNIRNVSDGTSLAAFSSDAGIAHLAVSPDQEMIAAIDVSKQIYFLQYSIP